MINVSFSAACLLYLGLMLGGMLLWGMMVYLKKRDLKKIETSKIYLCEYCQHSYIEDIDAVVTTCPLCQLINQ